MQAVVYLAVVILSLSVRIFGIPSPRIRCPPGKSMIYCVVDPCYVAPCPRYPDATCVSNNCGDCKAEWFSCHGQPINYIYDLRRNSFLIYFSFDSNVGKTSVSSKSHSIKAVSRQLSSLSGDGGGGKSMNTKSTNDSSARTLSKNKESSSLTMAKQRRDTSSSSTDSTSTTKTKDKIK
ncbi:unnamed protein product [Rotaria sp. Silwood1]|nr:unnamed protein product [Rotaria sp. Silwood1]